MIAPLVVIALPKTGAVVARKSTVEIIVTAGDDLGVISEVVVFVNNESVCKLSAPPFRCPWEVPAPPRKAYVLQASASDAAGNVGLSEIIRIRSDDPATKRPAEAQMRRLVPPRARTPWGTPEW